MISKRNNICKCCFETEAIGICEGCYNESSDIRTRKEIEEKLKHYKLFANKYDIDKGYIKALEWILKQ